MKKNKPLVVITGPTASGKSSLSLELAKKLNGEIISADSMQIYKHMNIGTAKISENNKEIPHHIIDFLEPNEDFSVAEFTELAHKTIEEIHIRGKIPFLVGGTGLYISSVVDNIQFFDLKENAELKKELNSFAEIHGNEALWQKLNDIDPDLASNLHPNNKGRVIRGIEVYESSGRPLSYWQKKSTEIPSEYDTVMIGLAYKNRKMLYDTIDKRVDKMVDLGLLKEAQALYDMGISQTANQAIGYKELWKYLEGEETLEEALDILKQNTRRYAKRQLTWMRGRKDLVWVFKDDFDTSEALENHVLGIIRKELQHFG